MQATRELKGRRLSSPEGRRLLGLASLEGRRLAAINPVLGAIARWLGLGPKTKTPDTTKEGEEVWEALDELLLEDFLREDPKRPALKVNSLAIDSGAYTQRVYQWVRKYGRTARVNAIKGRTGQGTFLGIPSLVDIMAHGRRIVKGCRVWPVDSGLGKEEVYGLLNHEPPLDEERAFPPGYCHFPAYGPEFFKNITSEVLVRRRVKSGKIALDWEVLPGRRNEPLDCRVYARAAAAILGIDRWTGQHWDQLLRGTSGEDDPEPRERKRGGGRWQRGRKRT